MNAQIAAIAQALWQAECAGVACAPVRDQVSVLAPEPSAALGVAYRVQRANTERALAAGRRQIGAKIGLTALAVQRQLGVDQPDFGVLFADMARLDGVPIKCGDVLQPRVEAEVALVLERDLQCPRNTIADLLRATAFALPAIEICGSRIAGWDIRLTDTVADNASAGLFVLGTRPVRLERLNLSGCTMRMQRGEDLVSSGSGAACLGNPLHAAIWLADTMAGLGAPLRAGDVILTGALGPMVAAEPGDRFTATIEGLGSVCAIFSD